MSIQILKTDFVRWKRFPTEGLKGDVIYQGFPADGPYDTTKYDIDQPTPTTFNLIIKKVDVKDAGTYECELVVYASSKGAALAKLVVVGT